MAESTEKKTVAERVADLSDEVLERLEARQCLMPASCSIFKPRPVAPFGLWPDLWM